MNVGFFVPSPSPSSLSLFFLSLFVVLIELNTLYARTNRPRAAKTTEIAMLDEPVRVAAPLKGATVLVGVEIGAEEEAPATPGTGAAGAGAAGAPVAAACAGAGVPATRPTLEEAPVLKAT